MKYSFHPEARDEFLNAIDYYEDCDIGLGYDFSREIFSTIKNILSFPKAWPLIENEIRRCQTQRFPFGIVYVEEEDAILILAVMHLRRDPDYWQGRLK